MHVLLQYQLLSLRRSAAQSSSHVFTLIVGVASCFDSIIVAWNSGFAHDPDHLLLLRMQTLTLAVAAQQHGLHPAQGFPDSLTATGSNVPAAKNQEDV